MQVAPHLKELARHAEVEPAPEPAPDTIRSKALLISTHALLPNRETLHIPYRNNINDWLEELNAIWVDLKQPTLRVFLPRGVRPEHFHGSKLQITKHAEFVVDGRPWN